MTFKIEDKKLLEKYKSVWNKTENILGNNFDKQPINWEKYLHTNYL